MVGHRYSQRLREGERKSYHTAALTKTPLGDIGSMDLGQQSHCLESHEAAATRSPCADE